MLNCDKQIFFLDVYEALPRKRVIYSGIYLTLVKRNKMRKSGGISNSAVEGYTLRPGGNTF